MRPSLGYSAVSRRHTQPDEFAGLLADPDGPAWMRLRPSIEAAGLSPDPGCPAATTEDRPIQAGLLPRTYVATRWNGARGSA
ncbi:hypothetical protein I551_4831 [Mycobacterium ulcerans str. Harvey]|uniref:Uncharacterized protein n=1 Tax=Mycobacterium ulcerans str. Harvey TaxID=1299332 RepID=A0ABP3AGJ7_MYCUL|nr:hypothetical protein I551_4831 [Mycobacterium ulcerans str. Harvey]